MNNINSRILNILECTNNVTNEEDIVLEDCGEFHEALSGYFIVLPEQYISDMKYCLIEIYKIQSDLVSEVFERGDMNYIVQTCRLPCGDSNYTDQFIKSAGSAENLIGKGIPNMLSDEDMEDEEEMYREMYEKLKQDTEEIISNKTKELDRVSLQLSELLKEKEIIEKSFGDLELLEDDDLGLVVEYLNILDPSQFKELVFDLLAKNAGGDDTPIAELKSLSFYIREISTWLLDNNVIG